MPHQADIAMTEFLQHEIGHLVALVAMTFVWQRWGEPMVRRYGVDLRRFT